MLMRYKRAFKAFFDKFLGWSLVMGAKCARLYKSKWFNDRNKFKELWYKGRRGGAFVLKSASKF